MVAALTADGLLTRVKARAQVPSTEGRVTDADILAMVDDLLVTELGLAVYDADDGRHIHTAPDVSLVASTAEYRLPARAWAGGVDQVLLVDGNGDTCPLDYVDRHEVPRWSGSSWTGTLAEPAARFTLIGDVIRLLPTPGSSVSGWSLRVRYVRRPNALVLVAACASISSLSASALTATYPAAAAWTSIDVIEGTHHGASLEDDVTVSLSGGSTITRSSGSFATSGAYTVSAGDYACEAGTTCVLQCPDVAVAFVVERTAGELCDVLGDSAGAQTRLALAEQKRRQMEGALAERSATRPRVIPYNSPLRASGMGPRTRWRLT